MESLIKCMSKEFNWALHFCDKRKGTFMSRCCAIGCLFRSCVYSRFVEKNTTDFIIRTLFCGTYFNTTTKWQTSICMSTEEFITWKSITIISNEKPTRFKRGATIPSLFYFLSSRVRFHSLLVISSQIHSFSVFAEALRYPTIRFLTPPTLSMFH